MININHLKKSYGSFTLECSLKVPKGMITGIIGMNGAGKTTLFKSILGINSIDEGNIEIPDKQDIGVVLADAFFSEFFTIKDIISILEVSYQRFEKNLFLQYCHQFELPLDKPIKTFSTGMLAKLKIIVSMTHHASLLILDEPTLGLDIIARESILELLRDYIEKEECSILISSHISSDLEELCDDIYVIDQGHIILHEEMDRILSNYGLIKVSKEDYEALDKNYITALLKEPYGYLLLTDQKQFYLDNYPHIVIENNHLDQMIPLLIKGEKK